VQQLAGKSSQTGLPSLCHHLSEPDRGRFLEEKENRDAVDHRLHDDKQSAGLIGSQKVQNWFDGDRNSEDEDQR